MFALGPGDKVRGASTAASVVEYVLCGFEGGEVKVLATGLLPLTTEDLYTAPDTGSYPGGGVFIKTISLVNTDVEKRAVNLYILPNGGVARRITPKDAEIDPTKQFLYD